MNFSMEEAIEILERTPQTLGEFLSGLSDQWLQCNEGEGTWNAFEVIEHLVEAEKTNWIPRLEFILHEGESKPFPSFDRFSHLKERSEKSIEQSLLEFRTIRSSNITKLKTLIEPKWHLEWTGIHPTVGVLKVRELISTWVVHDLTHTAQILRVMAHRYSTDVGPMKQFLSILKRL